MHDNCDSCGNDYEFDRAKDTLVMYVMTPWCNHVKACCPHCGNLTRIYLVPESVMAIAELHLPLNLGLEAPDEIKEAADSLWEDSEGGDMWLPWRRAVEDGGESYRQAFKDRAIASLPEPPRDWLIELHDTLRHLGGECGERCLWH